MVGGGLMQIIAYGMQNNFLTNNPEITFWREGRRGILNYDNLYNVDNCIEKNYTPTSYRIYDNFDIVYETYYSCGNASFTNEKKIDMINEIMPITYICCQQMICLK